MSSAANTTAPGQQSAAPRRRRHGKPSVTKRSAFQLLVGVLIVGAIPIVSTVRILQANALHNERSRADAALRSQLENALRELGQEGDDASTRAGDLARSPVLQRAVITNDRPTLRRLAGRSPGVAIYLKRTRVAGPPAGYGVQRSIWLTVNGARVARIVSAVPLGPALAARLTRDAPHGRGDRLVLVRGGRVLGSGSKLDTDGQTVTLGGARYRGVPALVPDAHGVRIVALRPQHVIASNIAPYQQRVRYAAIGSFALLVLVAFLFAGPILRVLGDFRRVASQATTDSLTGLANRRTLDEELALEWRRAERTGDALAFVLLDLDDFKQVNDSRGHQAGDAVLGRVGEILGGGVRQVDLAGRYGGEEFALILPGTDLDGAVQLAERLRATLESTPIDVPSGEPLIATASFGVAVKEAVDSPEQLVATADEALYAAKRAGKNRVVPEPAGAGGDGRKPERRRPRKTAPKKPAAPRKPAARKPKPADGEI
jgi:diguanylate cyclase (GGDEF)-like protein